MFSVQAENSPSAPTGTPQLHEGIDSWVWGVVRALVPLTPTLGEHIDVYKNRYKKQYPEHNIHHMLHHVPKE